ncbi:MAG: LptF/LptG family permease, partial [Chloroflexi bacterium]|nr:LptF/LptG family permease [Chloroflexota bacterium]
MALIGVVLSLVINNRYAPEAKSRYKNILANLVREDPLRFIVERTFIKDFPGYVLYVGSKKGSELRDFWIWELDDEYRALRVLRAKSGRFDYDEDSDTLILTLKNASAELRSESRPDDLQTIYPTAFFKETRLRLPLDRLLG